MLTLRNKIAVVIGASGGIGSAVVRRLHDEGMIVVLSARNSEKLYDTVKKLGIKGRFVVMPADFSDYEQAFRFFSDIDRQFGRIDVVVISSGGWKKLRLMDVTPDTTKMVSGIFESMISINLRACFYAGYFSALLMRKQGFGLIANLSSHIVSKILPENLAYATAKSGATAFMKNLAKELEPHEVKVIDIQPSTTNTPDMAELIPRDKAHLAVQPEEIADLIARIAKDPESVEGVEYPMIGALEDF